jgi:hypothetical protein
VTGPMPVYLKRAQARPEAAGQEVRGAVSEILRDVERAVEEGAPA